jgi:spore coat protein CotH
MIRQVLAAIFAVTFAFWAWGQPASRPAEGLSALRLTIDRGVGDNPTGFSFRFEAPGAEPSSLSGEIRLRGAYSKSFQKKSYALELDEAFAPLGMSYGRHWILNAAFIDRSLMRHKLSFDLFLSLSKPGAPRYAAASRFVEVYLNGDYRGVYLLMERVDAQLMQLTRTLPKDQSPACSYKAINHDANFSKAGHTGYEQREPDPEIKTYWKPMDELNDFMNSSDGKFWDPKTGIATRIDLDNAIDFHLLVLVTGNLDGITKNFFFSRDAEMGGSKPKFFFSPWDYDGTFGRNWNANRTSTDFWLSNNLFDRLMKDPDYKKRFQDRWRELREKQFSIKTICGMIDANVEVMGKSADRDAKRWESQEGVYPDALSFKEDISQMKQWVAARNAWLDKRILEEK